MKKITPGIAVFFCLLLCLGGCSFIKIEKEEGQKVDYTVVKEEDLPEDLKTLAEGKKKQEFQMTYQSGSELYLVKGYGQQMGGGYSIQVKKLLMTKNAIVFKTNLLGPSQEEERSSEPSYPYIVVKMEYRNLPVTFS